MVRQKKDADQLVEQEVRRRQKDMRALEEESAQALKLAMGEKREMERCLAERENKLKALSQTLWKTNSDWTEKIDKLKGDLEGQIHNMQNSLEVKELDLKFEREHIQRLEAEKLTIQQETQKEISDMRGQHE